MCAASDDNPTPMQAPDPFAVAFEAAAIGMALVGADGRLIRANATLCDMVGYSEPELCRFGLNALVVPGPHDEDASPDRQEVQLRHKSGRMVAAVRVRTPVPGEPGEPPRWLEQLQDLTERRRAEKEIVLLNNLLEQRIRRRTAELEESNEDLRDFAYSLAHDLRGPLASIDGFSAQLERILPAGLDQRSAHYLRRVRSGVRQMSELTDGLLALADIARAELQYQMVDLSAIAQAILERMHEHAPARRVSWQVEATPPARGDRRLLADVLENLLGNAWKFTSHKSQAHIAFSATTTPEGTCIYQVKDDGAGFDPAFIDKLFQPFHRLHTAAEFEGTGIGLAMVRKIVSRHGGRIWAEGRPGEGATFYFTLGGNATASA
jgi:PAS domain S-box-containing protein